MIITYKHEVAARIDTRVQYWSFLWQVNESSGRTTKEISTDIVDELDSLLGWWGVFRALWANSALTARFRLREISPSRSEWFDYFWRFATYGGLDPQEWGSIQIRLPIWWFSDQITCRTARTEIGMMRGSGVEQDQAVGLEFAVVRNWLDIHTAVHTTAFGDTFVPAIINSAGQIGTVTKYRLDGRVSTRKVKDRYR